MVLSLAASIDVHAACEDFVNPGEAETSVQGGAFEGRAVSGEGDALGDVSAASEFDFGSDAISLQVVGEVFPAVGVFQGGLDIIGHLVSDPFIGAESLCPCLGFAFAEGQTVFLLQFLADADIPLQPVTVGDSFTVVVHAVEDEVAMGIGSIVMPDYDILSILDSHLFHIFLCQLHHKIIGQARLVLRLEADGYVADWFADSWVQLGLDFKTFGSDLRVVWNDAVVGDYFCLVFAVGVCCAASERGTGYYFCYHNYSVLQISRLALLARNDNYKMPLCARDARSSRA